jgi:hypothetical protein
MHRDFTDIEILERFTESLPQLLKNQEGQQDHYFGISLREFIHEFKWQTLVLFKCALLQPKVHLYIMLQAEDKTRRRRVRQRLTNDRFFSSAPSVNAYA